MRNILFALLALPLFCHAQNYQLTKLAMGPKTSIRGVAVVSDKIAWVSGSGGYVACTLNGGESWNWQQIKGFEQTEFRDIQAFSDKKAVVMGIASPGYILITEDGGKQWKEAYKNTDSLIFLDGIDFWNTKKGMAYGDPIAGKLKLLSTINGGQTWADISDHLKQIAQKDEAGFAASGTGIKTLKGGYAWIVTGGGAANLYSTSNYGKTWSVSPIPIKIGEGTGPFSVAFCDKNNGIVVGGCYMRDKENVNNVLLTNNGGKTWRKPHTPILGFRSAVTYLTDKVLVATGTSGTDISTDGGENWKNISTLSFNAVIKSPTGGLVLLVGNNGNIYRLIKN